MGCLNFNSVWFMASNCWSKVKSEFETSHESVWKGVGSAISSST